MIAASRPACAVNKISAFEQDHDLAEIFFRDSLAPGDILDLDRLTSLGVLDNVRHREQSVKPF